MKIALLLSAFISFTGLAQDATVETSATAAEANRAKQRQLEAQRKAKEAAEQKPVTYSGFLVELTHAEKKSKLLSLRQPLDPKNDYRNVHLDERTGRPKGFILFSLDY